MELKNYQRNVLKSLRSYLRYYSGCGDAATAYNRYLADDGLVVGRNGVERYADDLGGTPKVCVKVPTGGGKTYIAANALDVICEELADRPSDTVVWLVPRKEILKQTLRQLRDPANPLRMALNRDFAHRVEVLDKEDGLRGRAFSRATVEDQLTVFVLSYDSFKNKDGRRAFAENSALAQLTEYQRRTGQSCDIEGADDTALISALAGTNPVVVVDESHHAKSSLSLEMLRNLNPRFVLELTATPRKGSNVISRVTARELKDEQMVKLPVIVYRRQGKREVVQDAILLRRKLELVARDAEAKGGGYVRPIALLQAESKGADDAETYERLRQKLIDAGIPPEQIAVRVSGKDELGDADLMSRGCPIRYVITVEALSEGWDCPFAYVLATVANKSSKVSVEQIVGRVLRQPHARRSPARSLNISYVLTSSEDFNDTIDQVIEGLNGAGFSKRDVVGGDAAPAPTAPRPEQRAIEYPPESPDVLDDDFELAFPALDGGEWTDGEGCQPESFPGTGVDEIIGDAEKAEEAFERAASEEQARGGASSTGLVDDMHENRVRASLAGSLEGLKLPVFRSNRSAGLFSDGESLPFEREMLLEGFDLKACGTEGVALDAVGHDDARQVDIDEESEELKVRELAKQQAEDLRGLLASYSDQGKRDAVRGGLVSLMSPQFQKAYGSRGLSSYVGRVVDQMTPEQIAVRVSGKDELGDADLMSRGCPIRYVITVEALSEGWDCPFAYVLATVANKSPKVSVEQIVGRVLRQPHARRSPARSLNISYVLTSSEDFNDTIDQVIEGLNGAGFSKRDVVGGDAAPAPTAPRPEQRAIEYPPESPDVLDDDFELAFPALDGGEWTDGEGCQPESFPGTGVDEIIGDAEKAEEAFERAASEEQARGGASSTGLVDDMHENRVRASLAGSLEGLKLPVFRSNRSAGLFSDGESLPFEREMLLEGFDLKACGTEGVALDAVGHDDARQVDIDEESEELKVRELAKQQAEDLRGLFASYSDQGKRDAVRGGLVSLMSPQFQKAYGSRGLSSYVGRVVDQMTPEQVDSYLDNGGRYARSIAAAIDRQAYEFSKRQFFKMLNDEIVLERAYELPAALAVRDATTRYDRTLYEAECGDMNGLERRMADALSNSEAVLWWHRVDERKKDAEFCINGFINHYPDFIAMTTSGSLLAVETKGEQLKNDDSRDKLELGGTWALMAGPGFRYCMVFDHDAIADKNSYTFDEFKAGVLNKVS